MHYDWTEKNTFGGWELSILISERNLMEHCQDITELTSFLFQTYQYLNSEKLFSSCCCNLKALLLYFSFLTSYAENCCLSTFLISWSTGSLRPPKAPWTQMIAAQRPHYPCCRSLPVLCPEITQLLLSLLRCRNFVFCGVRSICFTHSWSLIFLTWCF